MPKFHITDGGDPAVCEAKPGNCPKGEDAPHGEFESQAAARSWAEESNAKKYATVPEVEKPKRVKKNRLVENLGPEQVRGLAKGFEELYENSKYDDISPARLDRLWEISEDAKGFDGMDEKSKRNWAHRAANIAETVANRHDSIAVAKIYDELVDMGS